MLSQAQKKHIIETIKICLRKKFQNYKPETENMPFHFGLLGKDRMALFSFIHSLNTTFGASIYEPVARELAKLSFKEAHCQFDLGSTITQEAQLEILKIMNNLSVGGDVNKTEEIERIRKVARKGETNKLKPVKVDLFLISKGDEIFMFDLKTVKPNKKDFVSFKETLLNWLAMYLYQFPDAKVNTLIAIPYNPYEPDPYARWTMKGMLDLKKEVKVAEEFWDFLSGKGTYLDLLKCFEQAGVELRSEIDQHFQKFNLK